MLQFRSFGGRMENKFAIQLNILEEILKNKLEALDSIINIIDNTQNLLESKDYENMARLREIMMELGKEKQNWIDKVLEADESFQNIFSRIEQEFKEKAKNYKEQAQSIQKYISVVLEKDVIIRAKENSLKLTLEKIKPPQKRMPVNKAYILEQYKNSKKPQGDL